MSQNLLKKKQLLKSYRYNKSDDEIEKQEILGEIEKLSEKAKDVRGNLKTCEIIENRIPQIQETLLEREKKQNIKAQYKNNYYR